MLTMVCAWAEAVKGPMCAAFGARVHSLAPTMAPGFDVRVVDTISAEWLDHLLAQLRLSLDDADVIRAATDTVRWGQSHGLGGGEQAMAMQALSWACRDILLDQFSGEAARAMAMHEALLVRVSARVNVT